MESQSPLGLVAKFSNANRILQKTLAEEGEMDRTLDKLVEVDAEEDLEHR